MFEKKLKILLILSLFFLNQGCGYQPLLTEQSQKFNVKNFNISGDKKLGQILANNFNIVEESKNNLIFNINANKKREVTSRSSSGSPQEYNVNVNFNLTVISGTSGEKVFSKNFSMSSSYKASKLHLDTLNREKKIVDNIVKKLAEKITNNLNLIYN